MSRAERRVFKRLYATAMLFKGPKNSVPSMIVGHEPRQRKTVFHFLNPLCAEGRPNYGRSRYSYSPTCVHVAKRFSSPSPSPGKLAASKVSAKALCLPE